jgi:hypothetical protein
MGETEKERVDRELIELLNEVRVALAGITVLFGFLLALPFSTRFEKLDRLQLGTYLATFLLATASLALLVAPTAYHRVRFRKHGKEEMLRTLSRLTLVGIGLLALCLSAAVFLVGELMLSPAAAFAIAFVTLGVFVGLWFVVPILRRPDPREGGDRP